MIIYNETISVDQLIEVQWLEWLKIEFIPQVLRSGCFTKARLTRLNSHVQPDATNYSVQYFCEDPKLVAEFKSQYQSALKNLAFSKWGNKQVSFYTELELIRDFFAQQN